MYVSLIQLSGGVGSIVPENVTEYVLFIVNILIGSVLWAMVVGTICGVMTTGDPHTIRFKQDMDALNFFLDDMRMPKKICLRAREYLRNCRELSKKLSYNGLVDKLCPRLRAEVVLQMSSQVLETVWYFTEIEQEALVELAVKIDRAGYAPREKVPTLKLNVLMRGVAAKSGNILTYGAHWGEDMIIYSLALRDMRPISALTYIEVATLSRDDLFSVLERFDHSRAHIRQAAMKIAVQRAVVIISEYVRSRRDLQAKLSSDNAKLTSDLVTAVGQASGRMPDVDPTMILRIITGANLRDIDEDGYLVEEMDEKPLGSDEKIISLLEKERAENGEMRRELNSVKQDMSELKEMMRTLLERK